MRTRHLSSGDTVFLAYGADHSMVCCHCCEVHGFTFEPSAGGVTLRIWADKEATKKERAAKKNGKSKGGVK